MSDRHWHRPQTLITTRWSCGVKEALWKCECGKQLPWRRASEQK